MKTAGIITYWDTTDNYGTVLQNYALQSFLKKNGIEPILIRERSVFITSKKKRARRLLKKYGVFLPAYVCYILFKRIYITRNEKRNLKLRRFSDFRKQFISYTEKVYTSLEELKKEQSNYDLYIAGSDQIWSFNNCKEYTLEQEEYLFNTRFFNFVNKDAKRISCAASFGSCDFLEKQDMLIKSNLKKFDLITIREQSGVEYVKTLGINKVFFQNDPTTLLSAESYRKISVNPEKKHKYILLYLLNNSTDFNISNLRKWAKKKDLDIIYVNGNLLYFNLNLYKKKYPTIQEWLGLIDNAEYVLTNSFHGTIFSLILNTPFLTILQKGRFSGQNKRIYSILEEFSLDSQIYKGNFEAFGNKIDWNKINQMFGNIRKDSPFVKWIKEYLSEKGKDTL